MTANDDVTVEDVTVRRVDCREYEYAVAARATVIGPSGPVVLERRYEGLPRHNDVLEDDAVDSNDELLDRPDEIHLHTEFFTPDKSAYLGDEHDRWRPSDSSVLTDATAFAHACHEHFRGTAPSAYERVPFD